MENATLAARGSAPGTPARKSSTPARKTSTVVVIAKGDIADLKVRKQSANLLAQQLQQQLLLHQQRSVRRDQVRF